MTEVTSKNDFTEGSILKKLVGFMLPILGALVLQAMYGAVDILIVGKFGTTAGISGVSTGSNIINLVTFTVAGLSMGITVLIGRYIGEGRNDLIGKVIGGAIAFFFVISIAFTALMIIFARPLAILMQAPDEAIEVTVEYVRICGGGMIFIIAYNVISCIFRGLGESRLPLLFVAIACIVNILGDLLFVAVFDMNVAGAAIATVLAQAVSVVLSLVILKKKKLGFKFSVKDISFNGQVKSFLLLGAPIAVQEIFTNLSFLALCAFINGLGLDASSGYGVANKITGFIMLIPGALMQSMSSFIAQNVGSGKETRAKRAMLTGMGIGAFIGVFVAFLAYFGGDAVSAIFDDDPAVIARSAEYLRGFASEAIITCILFSFIGYYNGHGKTMFVVFQGLMQTFLVRLPMSYIMCIQPNASLTMIGLAAPSATVFGIIINVVYFIFYSRKLKAEALRL